MRVRYPPCERDVQYIFTIAFSASRYFAQVVHLGSATRIGVNEPIGCVLLALFASSDRMVRAAEAQIQLPV
jgi:hypothetical protein